jgi:hypothetical protein
MRRNPAAEEIHSRWLRRKLEWSQLSVMVDGASVAERVLADLERIFEEDGSGTMTLREAALLSGYSADYLGRLLREGKLTNHGRKGAPRILRRDLPKRPGRPVAVAPSVAYDPNTDARSLRIRR